MSASIGNHQHKRKGFGERFEAFMNEHTLEWKLKLAINHKITDIKTDHVLKAHKESQVQTSEESVLVLWRKPVW